MVLTGLAVVGRECPRCWPGRWGVGRPRSEKCRGRREELDAILRGLAAVYNDFLATEDALGDTGFERDEEERDDYGPSVGG